MTQSNAELAAKAEADAKARAQASQAAHDAAIAEGNAASVRENTRQKTVYMSPHTTGARKELARVLLKTTDMTAEAICAALAAAPAGDPAPGLSAPAPAEQPQQEIGPLSGPGGPFDPVMMKAGADSAQFLLGK